MQGEGYDIAVTDKNVNEEILCNGHGQPHVLTMLAGLNVYT